MATKTITIRVGLGLADEMEKAAGGQSINKWINDAIVARLNNESLVSLIIEQTSQIKKHVTDEIDRAAYEDGVK